jgi:hypothetical protein
LKHSYLLFIILQENIIIKVEKDDLSEEDSSDTKSGEDYIPSFSVKKAEPEVRCSLRFSYIV